MQDPRPMPGTEGPGPPAEAIGPRPRPGPRRPTCMPGSWQPSGSARCRMPAGSWCAPGVARSSSSERLRMEPSVMKRCASHGGLQASYPSTTASNSRGTGTCCYEPCFRPPRWDEPGYASVRCDAWSFRWIPGRTAMKALPFVLIYGSIAGLALVIGAVIWFPMVGELPREPDHQPPRPMPDDHVDGPAHGGQ